MKRYLIFILVMVVIFIAGRLTVKPKIITKTETKEVKVYDFTQEPRMMEIYATAIGKTLTSLEDVRNLRYQYWQEGYYEGYQEGFRKAKE